MVALAKKPASPETVPELFFARRSNQANWLTYTIEGQRIGLSKYRLYDADTGVFLSRDFLRFLNKYRAWSNNPVGQVDRDGLASADSWPRGGIAPSMPYYPPAQPAQPAAPSMPFPQGLLLAFTLPHPKHNQVTSIDFHGENPYGIPWQRDPMRVVDEYQMTRRRYVLEGDIHGFSRVTLNGDCKCVGIGTPPCDFHIECTYRLGGYIELIRSREGVYGHEQRHVLSMLEEVKKIFTRIYAEEEFTKCEPDSKACEQRAKRYAEKIAQLFDALVEKEKGHSNPLSPNAGTDYPPLWGMFPPRAKPNYYRKGSAK